MLPFPIIPSTVIRNSRYYDKLIFSQLAFGLLAKNTNQSLYVMGNSGKLGLGATFTSLIEISSSVVMAASNSDFAVQYRADGTWWFSGTTNPFGASTTNTWQNVSSRFSSVGTPKKLLVSGIAIYVMNTNNEVWGVGGNQYGSYGEGTTTTTTHRTFVKLNVPNIKDMFTYYSQPDNICLLQNDGTLIGAGYGGYIFGSTAPVTNSTFVTLSTDVQEVKVSNMALYVRKSDDNWYAQGTTFAGQFGNGVTTSTVIDWIQIPSPNASGIKSIFPGNGTTHIITKDNKLYYSGQHSSTAPISGSDQTGGIWSNNISTFTEITNFPVSVVSLIKDIQYFASISYFVSDYKIWAAGNSGSASLIPNYGANTTVRGLNLMVTPALA